MRNRQKLKILPYSTRYFRTKQMIFLSNLKHIPSDLLGCWTLVSSLVRKRTSTTTLRPILAIRSCGLMNRLSSILSPIISSHWFSPFSLHGLSTPIISHSRSRSGWLPIIIPVLRSMYNFPVNKQISCLCL